MKRMVIVRVERCLACRSCELACAVAHSSSKQLKALAASGERPGYRISVEAYGRRAVPIHCQHCEEAACVMACPTGAIHRKGKDDPVVVDVEKCVGCRMCVQACPFGVIALSSEGKGVLKCDLCVERLARGEEPACVSACPTGALTFGEEKTAAKEKRRKAAERLAAGAAEAEAEPPR